MAPGRHSSVASLQNSTVRGKYIRVGICFNAERYLLDSGESFISRAGIVRKRKRTSQLSPKLES